MTTMSSSSLLPCSGSAAPMVVAVEKPGESCAAQCLEFSLLGATFCPEFTHQIFPGERIPSYHPMVRRDVPTKAPVAADAAAIDGKHVIEDGPSTDAHQRRHPSFQLPATHELAIQIHLHPSCSACTLSIGTRLKNESLAHSNKRIKLQESSFHPINNHDFSSAGPNDACKDVEPDRNEPIQETPMLTSEIYASLQRHLPPILSCNGVTPAEIGSTARKVTESSLQLEYLTAPFGTVLCEYSCRNHDFCLSLCTGKDCVDYHNAVQQLAVYFIESADNVDVSDPAWKVLYLFCKHGKDENQPHRFSLAGYMTLYLFESPFRKPVGGTIVRVCQALILPPYQRSGHGSKMLHAVFDWATNSDNANVVAATDSLPLNIVEINVEDPAPAFAFLRLLVDYEHFVQGGRTWFGSSSSSSSDANTKMDCVENSFAPLTETLALEATRVAKTTTRQLQCVYELDTLHHLLERRRQQSTGVANDEPMDDTMKQFRLLVKQRLNKQNREELSACVDKKAAQALLATMFDDVYRDYTVILDRVK